MAYNTNTNFVNPADLFAFHPNTVPDPPLKSEWDVPEPFFTATPDSLDPWLINPAELTHSHQDSAVDLRRFYATGRGAMPRLKTDDSCEYDRFVTTPFSTPASNTSNTPSPHGDMVFSNANSPGDSHKDQSQTSSPETNSDVLAQGDSMPLPPPADAPNVTILVDRTKTRAETQIKTTLVLDPLPRQYQWARFPRHALSKSKQLATHDEIEANESANAAVRIDLQLVCATAVEKDQGLCLALRRARGEAHMPTRLPGQQVSEIDKEDPAHPQNGGPVIICEGCKERERKRYDRKKKRNQDEENEWNNYEDQRIIMINEKEFKRWQDPEEDQDHHYGPHAKKVDFAMRITCYCRHQEEKSPVGYKVIFTFRDTTDTILAQSVSEVIQITDDHKNRELPTVSSIATDVDVHPRTREETVPTQYSMSLYNKYPAPVYSMYASQPTTPILSQFQSPLSPMETQYPQPTNPAMASQISHQSAFFTAGSIAPSALATAPTPAPAPAPAPAPIPASIPASYANHQRYQSYSNTPMLSPTEQFVPQTGFSLHRPHSMDSFSAAFAGMYAQPNPYAQSFASQPPSRNVSRPASPSWDQGPSRSKKLRGVPNFYIEDPENE